MMAELVEDVRDVLYSLVGLVSLLVSFLLWVLRDE